MSSLTLYVFEFEFQIDLFQIDFADRFVQIIDVPNLSVYVKLIDGFKSAIYIL